MKKMKFLGQGFQKLDHEQNRDSHTHTNKQTNKQTQPNALAAAFATGKIAFINEFNDEFPGDTKGLSSLYGTHTYRTSD